MSDNGETRFRSFVGMSREARTWGIHTDHPTHDGIQSGALMRIADSLEQHIGNLEEMAAAQLGSLLPLDEELSYPQVFHRTTRMVLADRFLMREETRRRSRLPDGTRWRVAIWIVDLLRAGGKMRLPAPRTVFNTPSKIRNGYRSWKRIPFATEESTP